MALHPDFPDNPHAILDPDIRWFPADEALRASSFEKLLPPLVPTLRKEVKAWRDRGYDGATDTSKVLLRWWFVEQHLLPKADGSLHEFRYFFAQREALETIVYLYDVVGVKDKYDLMRFDSSGVVSSGMFDETWRRFVVKMATGAGKTKVLTKNCDDVAAYLEANYGDLKGAVLVIHTKNNGEISEASSGKSQEELDDVRRLANEIDASDNPYKAIVSVLMLKEGWDMHNVTTIVGLRAYSAKSNILPEQTLGRGLRKMYPSSVPEYLSVIGTDAFMEFVESIQAEGVVLERKPMGEGTGAKTPLVVEVDRENAQKDLDELDIEIPVLTPRTYREYKNLNLIDPARIEHAKQAYLTFSDEEKREIVFKDVTTGEITHTTVLDLADGAEATSAIGYFAQTIMKDLRLVSGYDVLYPKVKAFVRDHLFGQTVELDDANTLRNLSELAATKTIIDGFKRAINELTVTDKGDAEIRDRIKLRQTRPFVAKEQAFLIPRRSVFSRIIGDGGFELEFAAFLDGCDDIISFAKNYLAVGFKLDYVNAAGDISNYYPDFLVKVSARELFIVETKGREDLDVPLKMARLKQWCDDIHRAQADVRYDYVFVDEDGFKKYRPGSFRELVAGFRGYKK